MGKNKISLVLEGGGMRGAYTAGCLSWLIDEGIEFDCCYGISTGAVHLCSYLLKNKDYLHDFSTKYIADKRLIGISALFREGRIVSYDFLFNQILSKEIGYDLTPIINGKKDGKIGVYDLGKGVTEYISVKDINLDYLKAACSLPIIGKTVHTDGKEILDGGITKMIPIEEALYDGMNRHLIITTKSANFERKPAKEIVVKIMKWCYPQCKQISKDYKIRHLNYNKQIGIIKDLVAKKEAVYMYPSEEVGVSRLGGDEVKLKRLYELGRKDMENNREKVYELFK